MGRRRKIKVESNYNNENSNELEVGTNPTPETSEISDSNVSEASNDSETFDKSVETDLQEIDAIISQSKKPEEKRGRKSKEEKARVNIKIPGTLFVRMHNMVGANALGLIDTYIAKGDAIPTELLSMDEKMIQELAPVAELAMQEMKIEENPIAGFYIMFAAAMISQYSSLKVLIKQAKRENPEFKVQDILNVKKS
jgi:hypothetical protein